MSGDVLAQEDELLALASIYDNEVFSTSTDGGFPGAQFSASPDLPQPFIVTLNKSNPDVEATEMAHNIRFLPPIMLYIQLPPNYPSCRPPEFSLSCNWLTLKQLTKLCVKLDEIWEENYGMEVLFLWTSFLKDDVLDYLDIRSPLDLTNVVMNKPTRSRHASSGQKILVDKGSDISMNTDHNKSEVIRMNENTQSETYPKSDISDHVKLTMDANPTNLGRQDQSCDTCSASDQKTTATSELSALGAMASDMHVPHLDLLHYDPRAVQDIAFQHLLWPAVLDYNKTQTDLAFMQTLYTCQVCFGEKLGALCLQFTDCDHVYCKDCMKGYFEIQISDGNVKGLTCPTEGCDSQAHPAQVKDLVNHELFQRYDRLLLQSSLDTMSDIMYCPRQSCGCAVMIDRDGSMASCPQCHLVFCVFCKLVYHGVSPCRIKADEVRRLREEYLEASEAKKKQMERRYGRRAIQQVVEDSFSLEWLDQYSKKCPSCSTHIQKVDGCNKMTCTKCRCYFCWLCGGVISRNNPYSHFNNPGSDCYNRLFHGVVFSDEDDEDLEELFLQL